MELKINTICIYPQRYLCVPLDFPCKAPVFFLGSFMTCDGNITRRHYLLSCDGIYYYCTPLQRHRSGKYSLKNTLASVCSTLSKKGQKVYRPPSLAFSAPYKNLAQLEDSLIQSSSTSMPRGPTKLSGPFRAALCSAL